MKTRRMRKAESSSSDIISTLPQTILETILCLLPTEVAARTSILSREWRYKWTYIPKLEFHLSDMSKMISNDKEVQTKKKDRRCKLFDDLHQILVLHRGPIQEFSLIMDLSRVKHDSFVFDQLLLHLSNNHTIKKLELYGSDDRNYANLPISVFSMHHLVDLSLYALHLDDKPVFNVSGSLRSLTLCQVGISTKALLHLLSNSPSLKSLDLHVGLLGDLILGDEDCNIIELFKCLPVIEHLTIGGHATCDWLVLDSDPRELPALLFHLKYFCYEGVCSVNGHGLASLLNFIKCSPNLETIKLQVDWLCYRNGDYSVVWQEYSNVWLEHLTKLKINCFGNSKLEMKFVKFILARTPNLRNMSIRTFFHVDNVAVRRRFEKILLQGPRASPVIITIK